ncbi:hypothetical protein FJW04_24030 [Mesorhizobium sp. B2-7-3]|uniref:hypothetical protein n=1 Tax=Mesorhizobium sp. B2-7-3 TaxID=2589907 RepID=UPI00112C4BBD|nr:hypothetical protein [Mesorhizobium sp. B2-7-3]TPJ11430.1 hypothetical protein FJW04_24030 [Mesorhizobium sp. B2-7-3]
MKDADILIRSLNDEATDDEQAYLADKMFDALKLYDRHVQLALEMQEANGDELKVLQAIRSYLSETAIPAWITMPIWLRITALRDKGFRKSSASLPEAQLWPKAFAAAAVSQYMLLGLRNLNDATEHVAKLTGIDPEVIEAFRENTKKGKEKRGKEKPARKVAYEQSMTFLETIPVDVFDASASEMLAQISSVPADKKKAIKRIRKSDL